MTPENRFSVMNTSNICAGVDNDAFCVRLYTPNQTIDPCIPRPNERSNNFSFWRWSENNRESRALFVPSLNAFDVFFLLYFSLLCHSQFPSLTSGARIWQSNGFVRIYSLRVQLCILRENVFNDVIESDESKQKPRRHRSNRDFACFSVGDAWQQINNKEKAQNRTERFWINWWRLLFNWLR